MQAREGLQSIVKKHTLYLVILLLHSPLEVASCPSVTLAARGSQWSFSYTCRQRQLVVLLLHSPLEVSSDPSFTLAARGSYWSFSCIRCWRQLVIIPRRKQKEAGESNQVGKATLRKICIDLRTITPRTVAAVVRTIVIAKYIPVKPSLFLNVENTSITYLFPSFSVRPSNLLHVLQQPILVSINPTQIVIFKS